MRRRTVGLGVAGAALLIAPLIACSVTLGSRAYRGAAVAVPVGSGAPAPQGPPAAGSASQTDLRSTSMPSAASEPATPESATLEPQAPAATEAPTEVPVPPASPTAPPRPAPSSPPAPQVLPAQPVPAAAAGVELASTAECDPEQLALLPASTAPLSPLTGLVPRPLLVQIDNAIPARPPLHLSDAAVVYESVAEGGVTRFSALFTRDDVGVVGPVRSARLISIEVARQFDALLVYHGASTGVQNFIWDGGIKWVSFNVPDTASIQGRLNTRPVPHNSITQLPSVRDYAVRHGIGGTIEAGRDLPRGAVPANLPGRPTTRFSVGFANPDGAPFPGYRAEFSWNGDLGRYVRSIGGVPHVDGATNLPISAETVVVQVAPVVITDIVEDILGSRSLDYHLVGAGLAYFLRDGQRWEGCWYRPDPFAMTRYVMTDGTLFPFAEGPVWVSVAMPNTQLRWDGF